MRPSAAPDRRCAGVGVLFLIGVLLLNIAVVQAAPGYQPYAWADADLALLYPADWNAPAAESADSAYTLTLSSGDSQIDLVVLPVATGEAERRAALDAQIAALGLLPLRYDLADLYGRSGLTADAVSADRQLVGAARAGRLPDDRTLIAAGRAPQAAADALVADLDLILNSLVFSAAAPPVAPSYHALWATAPSGAVTIALAAAGDRLYGVSAEGVQVYAPATGALAAAYPFDRPAQPTGLAAGADGTVYVADTVCRCLRVLDAGGRWSDMLGSFGGGAPSSLALAPDGTLYAVDKTDEGYLLRLLNGKLSRRLSLNFNASAAPLVSVDAGGQVWVVEWLASLIDGATSGAVSRVDGGAMPTAALQFWLAGLTPETVTTVTGAPGGGLAVATSDQGILLVDSAGQVVDTIGQSARALAFGADGTLYAAQPDGALTALSTGGTPDHFGGATLLPGVPVGGSLSESAPEQVWKYSGAAGERLTFSAVDQTRTDVYALGLDMALRLSAPDGSEVAYNDDQQGADLFGVYDAQIADVTLPQTGIYTLRVEWRQGQGGYTLGVSAAQPAAPGADGVTRIEGRLQDVFPVQRWTLAGHAGDVLTLTMSAESGTLDPALALYKPDGSLLAFNDDARDTELATSAQLSQVRLPVDGSYTVAASRYEGAGRYSIIIVNTG